MSINESDRYRLHQRLEEKLGPQEAATLMSYLPPTGWADVATKQDLAVLREQMVTKAEFAEGLHDLEVRLDTKFEARFTRIDSRFDKLRDDIRIWNLSTLVAFILAILGQRLIP